MKINRRLALGLAVLVMGAGMTVAAHAQDPLKVAAYPATPPWENKTESGAFEGFEVDIVNEIAKRMGTTADIEGMDFKALFVASAAGRVDMVISSLTITDERLKSQSFTQPYFEGALGVGVKEGSGITSLEGLKGKVIGTVATSFPEKYLAEHKDQIGFAENKSYDTTANMLTDLQNGRIDAVVNDVVGLRYAFGQMKGLTVGAEIVTGEKFAIMMPKDSDKLQKANDIISEMKKDGTLPKMYEKWMGVAPAAGSFAVTPMPVPTSAN